MNDKTLQAAHLYFSRHAHTRHDGAPCEEPFFGLTDNLPVKIEFLLGDAQADSLAPLVRDAGVDAVHARAQASFAVLDKACGGPTVHPSFIVASATTQALRNL